RGGPVRAAPHAGVGAASVAEAFRRSALPFVLHALGREVLHASAVVTRRGVVAFCGASGSGKSTTAYALARAGFPQWADDALVLDIGAGGGLALPSPFAVSLRPGAAAMLGLGHRAVRLSPQASEPRAALPVAAICLLGRDGGDVADQQRLAPLGGGAVFSSVLAHAFCFSLRDRERKRVMLDR